MLDKVGARNLEFEYGEKYSNYYYNLVWGTYNAIGKKKDEHLQSLARFNIIFQGETNDFDRAAEIAKDRSRKAEILRALSQILSGLGILSKSLEYGKRSLEVHREINDTVGMTADYTNIGVVPSKIGKLQEALDSHNKALEIDMQLNNTVGLAGDYGNIGNVTWNMGRLQEALDSHNKALEIHKELNDIVGLAGDYYNINFVFTNKQRTKKKH